MPPLRSRSGRLSEAPPRAPGNGDTRGSADAPTDPPVLAPQGAALGNPLERMRGETWGRMPPGRPQTGALGPMSGPRGTDPLPLGYASLGGPSGPVSGVFENSCVK